MLVIFTTDGHEITWHVGEPVPEMWGKDKKRHNGLDRISFLQADGHELEHITKVFTTQQTVHAPPGEEPASIKMDVPSLPMPSKSVCRWSGDLAKTIYLNL